MGGGDQRKAILARRARFIAIALAGVAATAAGAESLEACGGSTESSSGGQKTNDPQENPKPCLGKQYDPNEDIPTVGGGDGGVDGAATDAAGPTDAKEDVTKFPPDDGGIPQPCLVPPLDPDF